MLAEPLVVHRRQPSVTAVKIVLYNIFHGERIKIVTLELLLGRLNLVEHLLRDNGCLEGQLIGDLLQESFALDEFTSACDLDNNTSRLYRRNIMIYRTFAATHTLSLSLLGYRLPWCGHAPCGKHCVHIHFATDRQTHHLKVAITQAATSSSDYGILLVEQLIVHEFGTAHVAETFLHFGGPQIWRMLRLTFHDAQLGPLDFLDVCNCFALKFVLCKIIKRFTFIFDWRCKILETGCASVVNISS